MVGHLRWRWALAVLVAAAPVRANPLDVFGFTSRRAGQANTGVAAADDASALYYDPAGLVASPGGELALGTLAAYSNLAINRQQVALDEPLGFQLAVRAPLPLGGALADRIALGLGLHLVPSHVARIRAPAPDEAVYPYYGDRLSRFVVLPGAAVRLGGGISIGAAVDVLASLDASTTAAERDSGELAARADARVPAVARAIAGVHWQLSRALRLGAVFRERFETPVTVTTRATVAGERVELDVRTAGQFTPHQLGAGLAWTSESFAAAIDLGWAKWSDYAGPYARAAARLPDGPVSGQPPQVPFRDAFSVRTGLESVTTEGPVYRLGYGLESSPVPREQRGVTNLLDGTRHTVAFGGGWAWPGLRVDAHVQFQLVSARRTTKAVFDGDGAYDPYTSLRDEDDGRAGTQISNPGYPEIRSGGEVISAGVTLEVPL